MNEKVQAPALAGASVAPGLASRYKWGIFFAVLGSISFSGKGIIVKLGYQYGADAVTLLMLRMLFSLPLFLGMAWWAGRNKPALTRRDWLSLMGLGFLGFYLSSAMSFLGLQYITASLERLILCLQPTLVLIFARLFFQKKIQTGHLLGIFISYAGVLCVFGFEAAQNTQQSVMLGVGLAFMSTLTYVVYLIWSGDFVKRLGALRLVGWASSFAGFFAIVQYLVLRPVSALWTITPAVLGLSWFNAVLCTAFPTLAVMLAIERIGPATASQVGMIGTISTILLGVLILNEPLTFSIAIGALCVIAGVMIFTRTDSASAQRTKSFGHRS